MPNGTAGLLAPVTLDEYTPAGALVQSLRLPSDGVRSAGGMYSLTLPAADDRGGALSLSADGRRLLAAGYHLPAGSATSGIVPALRRVVADVDAGGGANTSTGAPFGSAGEAQVSGACSANNTKPTAGLSPQSSIGWCAPAWRRCHHGSIKNR